MSRRFVSMNYTTANDINDACSRIEAVINTTDSVDLAAYQYLGASGFVNAASAQAGINWTLIGSGNDPNTGDKQRKLAKTTCCQYSPPTLRRWLNGFCTTQSELESNDAVVQKPNSTRINLGGGDRGESQFKK